jgi:hypothetical protein
MTNQINAHPSASWKLRAISTPLLGSCHTIRVSVSQVRHMTSVERILDMLTCLAVSGIHLPFESSFLIKDGRDGLLIRRLRAGLCDRLQARAPQSA